jgi:hypothetical protein
MFKTTIPMPLLLVIDDVAWWSGKDGHENNEPFRTGISRNHCIEDYQAIIDLGKAIDMRIQAAFVLCEWDRENILKELPESTWMGRDWANYTDCNMLDAVAKLLNENSNYIDVSLHSLAHEFWDDNGKMSRAEWADEHGTMRPVEMVKKHLDAFFEIVKQNKLTMPINSFIPPAFRHRFEGGFSPILKEYGIDFISTDFERLVDVEKLPHKLFGVDNGIPTICRGRNGIPWFELNPNIDDKIFTGPICGIHWPNVLHHDPVRNGEVVEYWAKNLKKQSGRPDLILSKDMNECWSQLAHQCYTKVTYENNELQFNFNELEAMKLPLLNNYFYIKIESDDDISKTYDILNKEGNVYTIKINYNQ